MNTTHRPARVLALLCLLAVAACDGGGTPRDAAAPPPSAATTDAPASPAGDSAAETAAAPAPASAPADTGLSALVTRQGEGRYLVVGRTRAADALQISVEDGHDVLYGPADVSVTGGAFRAEITLEPTTRPTVFVYIAEPEGTKEWVIPVPLDREHVAWGPAAASLQAGAP